MGCVKASTAATPTPSPVAGRRWWPRLAGLDWLAIVLLVAGLLAVATGGASR